ncbi:hypothetical protein BSKO_14088 [Bryopsis sp. KO-2023]|nr:hypothetical protein BSKO_14088 [Bryopsis sp. KO-2023]
MLSIFGKKAKPRLDINVRTVDGRIFGLRVLSTTSIHDLKRAIGRRENLTPSTQLQLVFSWRKLEDAESLAHYGIKTGSTLHVFCGLSKPKFMCVQLGMGLVRTSTPRFAGRVPGLEKVCVCSNLPIGVNARYLDSSHDLDFTDAKDTYKVFRRAGEIYEKPFGWRRYGLAVLGKYENDDWLGHGSSVGEWPVAYHGTKKECVEPICRLGFRLSEGRQFVHGRGIYTSPNLETAARFARSFPSSCPLCVGSTCQVVLQTRVNPGTLHKVWPYWLNPNEEDVRPYAILIRKTPLGEAKLRPALHFQKRIP